MPVVWITPVPRQGVDRSTFLAALSVAIGTDVTRPPGNRLGDRFPDCEYALQAPRTVLEKEQLPGMHSALDAVCERIDVRWESEWLPEPPMHVVAKL